MKRSGPFLEIVSTAREAAIGDVEVERVLGAARALADPDGDHRERASAALRAALPRADSPTPLHPAQPRNTPSAGSEWGGWFEVVVHAPPTPLRPGSGAARDDAPFDVGGSSRRRPAGLTPALLLGGALLGALGFWLGHGMGKEAGRREASRTAGAALELAPAPGEPVERVESPVAPESVGPPNVTPSASIAPAASPARATPPAAPAR